MFPYTGLRTTPWLLAGVAGLLMACVHLQLYYSLVTYVDTSGKLCNMIPVLNMMLPLVQYDMHSSIRMHSALRSQVTTDSVVT